MTSWKRPQPQDCVALLGGTFDPPHRGHQQLIIDLLETGFRSVWVIPSALPPHRSARSTSQVRWELVGLAVQDIKIERPDLSERISALDIELQRSARHPGQPSYTIDTLQELAPRGLALAFALGTDQASRLPTWHRFPEVLGHAHWVFVARKPDSVAQIREAGARLEREGYARSQGDAGPQGQPCWQLMGSSRWLMGLETRAPELSSTHLRQTLAREGAKFLASPEAGSALSPGVLEYLKEHRLYGS